MTLAQCIAISLDVLEIGDADLTGRQPTRVAKRELLYWLCRNLSPAPVEEIARRCGAAHHPLVLGAIARVERRTMDDPRHHEAVHALRRAVLEVARMQYQAEPMYRQETQ